MSTESHGDETQPGVDTVRLDRPGHPDRPQKLQRNGGLGLWQVSYLVLWIVTIGSLLLNLVILRRLENARQLGRQAVLDAVAVIADIQTKTFSQTIVVDRTLEIDTDMPVNETIPVSINETIPVNTTVTVPVDAGPLGTFPLDIPIATSIPIDLDVDIVIDRTFHVNAAVPVYFEVPVVIAVEDTPLHDTLSDMQIRLEALAVQLDQPIVPFLSPRATPDGG
jgi:hypothetical protein